MLTLTALLIENGLPNLPVQLIEPHRNRAGVWRIKFNYEVGEPLSMSAGQASTMASSLNDIGETNWLTNSTARSRVRCVTRPCEIRVHLF
jgi:hypothetical protein